MLSWAQAVAKGLRGSNPWLDNAFDEAADALSTKLSNAAGPGKPGELFIEDMPGKYRSVEVSVTKDGGISIDTHDMGQVTEEFWGDADYEHWVTVPPDAVPKLAVALLFDRYFGNSEATNEFTAFCKAREIPHKWADWV